MVVKLVTVRGVDVNWSVARTVRVAVLGPQGFNGTQLPLNEAIWPTAEVGEEQHRETARH